MLFILVGYDVVVMVWMGFGKMVVFLILMIEKLVEYLNNVGVRVVILFFFREFVL